MHGAGLNYAGAVGSHSLYLCFLLFFKFVHFLYLFSRCNNQQNCDISAENDNFGGDPCPNIPKYLEVYFGCFDGKFFFICVVIWGDIWHIFKILYLLFCSIYSRLSCTLVIFCVRHYLFLALWFWTVLNGSSVFEILFILFLRSKVSSPSASFCPWDQSSWKTAGSLTSSVGVTSDQTARWTPAWTSGSSPTPALALRSIWRPITSVTVSVRALRPKVGQQRN